MTAMHGYLVESAQQPAEIYRVGLNTTRLLLALGDLIIGWLLARQAEVAQGRLDEGPAAAPVTGRSTRARSRPPGSSPRRYCPGWPPSARSSRRPPST